MQSTTRLLLTFCIISFSTAFIPSYLSPGSKPKGQIGSNVQYDYRVNGPSVEDSLDAGIVHSYINAPYLEQDNEEEICENMPNRTKSRPAFYQCSEDTPLTLHGGAITNITGDDHYPVTFSEPIRIFLDVTSSARRRFDNLGVEVSLYKRTSGWFGCGWMFLPSFGMLSNFDMCFDNPSCPISPGRQVIEFVVDPSHLFTRLFRMIHQDMTAYQLVIRVKDNNNPYDDLLCATIQTRIRL